MSGQPTPPRQLPQTPAGLGPALDDRRIRVRAEVCRSGQARATHRNRVVRKRVGKGVRTASRVHTTRHTVFSFTGVTELFIVKLYSNYIRTIFELIPK